MDTGSQNIARAKHPSIHPSIESHHSYRRQTYVAALEPAVEAGEEKRAPVQMTRREEKIASRKENEE